MIVTEYHHLLLKILEPFLLGFIISFDEFLLAMFLQGSDQTLPIYMWGQLRFARRLPHVLALGAVIIVATSLIVMLAYWLRNVGQPQDKQDLTFKM